MPTASPRPTKGAHEVATLAAVTAAAATAGTATTAIRLPVAPSYAFVLDVTAAATEVGDTLDVYVQSKLDGTNYVDVVHFTQVLGNGGAKRYIGKITPGAVAETMFENGAALAASAVRNLAGDEWRVNYVVVEANANANAAFSFTVTAIPQ